MRLVTIVPLTRLPDILFSPRCRGAAEGLSPVRKLAGLLLFGVTAMLDILHPPYNVKAGDVVRVSF
ncbi:MAG TPA: hypothetical protein VEH30_02030 [Terriglobales bacterium]|nr:hypothetical protein [Terriglobales bacterium]